jgi:SAM-dependent methyltransferase
MTILKKFSYALNQIKKIDALEKKINYLSVMNQQFIPDVFNLRLEKVNVNTLISKNDMMFKYSLMNNHSFDEAVKDYFSIGLTTFETLDTLVLSKMGCKLSQVGSILDFGSGYGRVSRYLIESNPNTFCCDFKNGASNFCQEHLGLSAINFDHFWSRAFAFDIIYAGSLFSHLPLSLFDKYILKLFDSLKPGGLLIFSTHNARNTKSKGFDFEFLPFSEDLIFKEVPDHLHESNSYGSSYVTRDFVNSVMNKFNIYNFDYHPSLLGGVQDIYCCSKST